METKMETSGNALGNTKTRAIPSKKWCFTLNNYEKNDLEILETKFLGHKYIMGKEVGENGTPHIQGYIEFADKKRPIEFIKDKRIHWEKAKGNKEANLKYCSKDDNFVTNFEMRKKIKDPLDGKVLYDWQKEILELVKTEPDDRSIYWYWEPNGNCGKSALTKHICMNYKAMMVEGKGNDIKYGIAEWIAEKDLDIVIMDFERSLEEYVSYSCIEKIKNGCFYNNKYESKQCIFNPPHIVIFANFEPNISKLSKDRWKIKELVQEHSEG